MKKIILIVLLFAAAQSHAQTYHIHPDSTVWAIKPQPDSVNVTQSVSSKILTAAYNRAKQDSINYVNDIATIKRITTIRKQLGLK